MGQNLFLMISGRAFSFLLYIYAAKIFDFKLYASYVLILIVVALMPLFHFGLVNGSQVVLPKLRSKPNDIVFTNFYGVLVYGVLFQYIVSVPLLFFFLVDISLYCTLLVALDMVLLRFLEALKIGCESALKFSYANRVKLIIFSVRPAFSLLLLVISGSLESIFAGGALGSLIGVYMATRGGYVPKSTINILRLKRILKYLFVIGFPVYLTSCIDLALRSLDRWFVAYFYAEYDLALYGFCSNLALNLWMVSLAVVAPLVPILHQSVARKEYAEAYKVVYRGKLVMFVLCILGFTLALLLYNSLTEDVIGKYSDGFGLFMILGVGAIFLSLNNMFIYFFISIGKKALILTSQLVLLLSNVAMNAVCVSLGLGLLYIASMTAISLLIYYIVLFYNFRLLSQGSS